MVKKTSTDGHITMDDPSVPITLPEGSETTIEHTSIDCGSYAVDVWTPLRNERDKHHTAETTGHRLIAIAIIVIGMPVMMAVSWMIGKCYMYIGGL